MPAELTYPESATQNPGTNPEMSVLGNNHSIAAMVIEVMALEC